MSRGEARETEWTHEAIVIGVGQRAAFGSSAAAAPHTEVQAGRRGAARFGAALVESVTAPLTMTQHGWDKLYAEYKESGE